MTKQETEDFKALNDQLNEANEALRQANEENNRLSEEVDFYKKKCEQLVRPDPSNGQVEHFAHLASVYRDALIQLAKEVN